MPDNYPTGMTMNEFDRTNQDDSDRCCHGNWAQECDTCYDHYKSEAADRRLSETKEQSPDYC